MPALGELFLPGHTSGATTIIGNSDLVAESSLEGAARLYTHVGGVQNELRGSALFIDQPILYQLNGNTLRPENASNQEMFFVEDRLRIETSGHRLNYRLEASAAVAIGDRVGYFSAVPRVRAQAELTLGSEFFKGSSSLYYSVQYVYTSTRNSRGVELEPFGVLNMQLRARLINAFLYMRLLNVVDEKYITVYPYLMTPRTFVFGIVWAVFS